VKVAYLFKFDPGTIVVDDRGYNDYHLFAKWTSEGVFFVTRQKENAIYTVMEERVVPKNRSFLKDEIILFTGTGAAENVLIPCGGSNTFMRRRTKPLFI